MSELLANINDAFGSVTYVVENFSTTIAQTPMLLLFCVALPVISFGVGLLIRALHRA